jgi:radical SAM superfamily enzyme YgiQ (UPF0313 family)
MIHSALGIAQAVRDINAELPIIWGGPHPSLVPEQTLRHPLVDIIVVNEGDRTILELVKALASAVIGVRRWPTPEGYAQTRGGMQGIQGKVLTWRNFCCRAVYMIILPLKEETFRGKICGREVSNHFLLG